MVHALHEVQRVLAPGGILIDLRPVADRWPVEIMSGYKSHEAGRLSDLPTGLADDEAANQSIAQASARDWFVREQKEFFPFFYYWDTPKEMREYINDKWGDFVSLDDNLRGNLDLLWAAADAGALVRIQLKMLITRWRKNSQPGS